MPKRAYPVSYTHLDALGLYETAFPALIEFYGNFIGKFADNEEAIRLICRFYPQKELSGLSVDRTAETLFAQIRHAGTMKDHGYAYHGIETVSYTHLMFLRRSSVPSLSME